MKIKRILAAALSALMLASMLVFTANAQDSFVYKLVAHKGYDGFSAEAVTATLKYDEANDIVYYNYVPKDHSDWMHFGWHNASDKFTWETPMTVGLVMRTNKAGATPSFRYCDRAGSFYHVDKNATAPVKGDGSWEIVWFSEVTEQDILNIEKDGVKFDGLTHVQGFALGQALVGKDHLDSGVYFDVAGYAFFNDTPDNLADIDLIELLDAGAPEITLSFDAKNGTEVTSYTEKSGNFVAGKVKFPETPEAPEGKVFAGWSTDVNAATGVTEADIPAGDTTYYAIWAQDESAPGDVTLKEIRVNGTLSTIFGLEDLSGETLTLNVPYNWNGDKVPTLTVIANDGTANVTVEAGTFGEGSTVKVKNGSAVVTYNIVYNNAEKGSKTFTPGGAVTSNPTNYKVPYNGGEYVVSGTTFISPATVTGGAEIDGGKGTKIAYNTKVNLVPAANAVVDDAAKTITGNSSYFTIASGSTPAYEGGGAFGFVTLSDYPWARVKYYVDAGEDGKTVARPFELGTTTWNNNAAAKGYAESTKKNTSAFSDGDMVTGRWAYAYINLAEKFAEDYGYTYQFHLRPFKNDHKAVNVMKASEDDPTVAVQIDAAEGKYPELFDDAFYIGALEIFNEFPGTADGKYEQIAPFAGLFATTDETEADANDGTISGLTEGMEYSLKDADEWTAYTESELQGEVTLAPGTYEIRYAAYDNFAASPAVEVTIKSALAAQPEVTAVNATAVGANDGKVTGVDAAMSYRAKGATEWTAVADSATEITDLVPGEYEFIYLADGEVRTENSEITTVTVLVDFPEADNVFYVTNNAEHSDATVYDGSTYEKAYLVNQGKLISAALGKYLAKDKTTVMVVVDGITLGAWNENVGRGNGAHLVITGLKPEAYIDFACHNVSGNNFAMQNFGDVATLTIENITLQKTCLNGEAITSECGITVSAMTDFIAGEGIIAGPNADKIRIYNNNNSTLSGSYLLKSGKFEGVVAGPTYTNATVSQGDFSITLDGADVSTISATRHQRAWLGDFNVVINDGNVRNDVYAGTFPGAFGGDAYVEINGGTVNKLYTTALAREDIFNSNGNKYYTGKGITAGSSVVVISGGEVKAFAKGAQAPGGSALIVGKDATVPELTGAESDYVIKIDDTSLIEVIVEENDYTYESYERVLKSGETEITATKKGDIAYKANTIKGFKVTIPEDCNAVKLNGEVIELTDGVLALDALSKDAVNEIKFVATWILKADLNGGNMAADLSDERFENVRAIFEDGYPIESDKIEPFPNADDFIKPYRSGYKLAGWALAPEATADECLEFPYTMTGDTTFYAIWEDNNDTPLEAYDDEDALEKDYYTYATVDVDTFTIPEKITTLGEAEKLGAYCVTLIDMATGEESDADTLIVFDANNFDLEGKYLCVLDEDGTVYGMSDLGNGKYWATMTPGTEFLLFSLDPVASYEAEGTYYAKRNEYIVDVYYDGPAANAGSIGFKYYDTDATFVDVIAAENVQIIKTEAEVLDEGENVIYATWGVADGAASVGGDGRLHIITLNFTMTPEQRESYVELGYDITIYVEGNIEEVCEDGCYLVAKHDVNNLAVEYIPVVSTYTFDKVGPDDMVTVKGTVEMAAREDGSTPVEGNYATLYWRHKGAASYNKVVIEDADTDTSVVEYVLEDVPADTEIEIYVEKNGYLTEKAVFVFEAKTEEETEEKPEREADAIVLTAGDIKGDFDDFCGDGKINIADFVRVLRGFDEAATDEYKFVVDVNEDGEINVTDLGWVKANFGAVAE